MNGSRDYALDLYRIVLMIGICLLHCVHQGIKDCRPITMLLLSCVDGFVFISGWFGIKFRWRKILDLYVTAAYAALVSVFILSRIDGNGVNWMYAIDIWKNYWFLHAYVLLMLFSPCINCVVDQLDGKKLATTVIPVLAIAFVWSFMQDVPVIRRFVPVSHGICAYSGVTFISIYTFGRLARKFDFDKRVGAKTILVSILICSGICVAGFGRYHSPFAVLLSAMWCFSFMKHPIHGMWAGRLIGLLTPSLFSVYLLHAHSRVGFRIIKELEYRLAEFLNVSDGHGWFFSIYIIACVVVFLVCLLLDIPRRLSVAVLCRIVDRVGKN